MSRRAAPTGPDSVYYASLPFRNHNAVAPQVRTTGTDGFSLFAEAYGAPMANDVANYAGPEGGVMEPMGSDPFANSAPILSAPEEIPAMGRAASRSAAYAPDLGFRR